MLLRDAARGRAGGAAAPPDFGRSVNPISTRGADYAHHSTTCPPGFLTLAASLRYRSCLCLTIRLRVGEQENDFQKQKMFFRSKSSDVNLYLISVVVRSFSM